MTQIGMHVRPANAHGRDPDQFLACMRFRVRHLAQHKGFRAVIDQRLHFAVNPPSTIRTCPVTYRDASEHCKSNGPSMSDRSPLRPMQVCARSEEHTSE